MTKADLISEIAISTGYDKKTISAIVEAFMEGEKQNMAKGENVYLRSFGSFILHFGNFAFNRRLGFFRSLSSIRGQRLDLLGQLIDSLLFYI